ncbi:MAG: Veg family protein [Bacilli bacterium]
MTLQEIKEKVNNNIGNNVTIKYNIGRNRIEKYNVKIKETYKNIFIVETNNTNNIEIKSFTYTDVMTKTIKIDY